MNVLLRKLRGLLGIGLTWGCAWAVFGMAIWLVLRVARPQDIDPGEGLLVALKVFGTVGFLSGLAFGFLMAVAESRKKILQLSLGRIALWGAVASAAFPLLTGRADMVWLLCPLGAICASASVAIARKGELPSPEHAELLS